MLLALLKARNLRFMHRYAARVRRVADDAAFDGFFRPTSILVPIPGSVARLGGRSVAESLAAALLGEELGDRVWHGLYRSSPLRRSATAPPGSRPSVVDHYASLAVRSCPWPAVAAAYSRTAAPPVALAPFPQFLLVDDVVTKGRTLLAAAARIRAAYPNADVRAFALLRTMGLVAGVDRLVSPCVGTIRWRRGDACRTP